MSDQSVGVGKLYEGKNLLGEVHYHFKRVPERIRAGNEIFEGTHKLVGAISRHYTSGTRVDFFGLVGKTLTLHLEDGRLLEFHTNDGEINLRKLYRPNDDSN